LREVMESGDLHLISMAEGAAGMLVPSKLYSALAVHRPCVFVGPKGSEIAKVLKDYSAGSTVDAGDGDALAACVRSYVKDSKIWHNAHEGAVKASEIFVPKEAIEAWIERAWTVVKEDVK